MFSGRLLRPASQGQLRGAAQFLPGSAPGSLYRDPVNDDRKVARVVCGVRASFLTATYAGLLRSNVVADHRATNSVFADREVQMPFTDDQIESHTTGQPGGK